jgi:lysophospholipase L1-like esterase
MRRALFRFDAVLVAARAVTATQAVDQAGSAVLPPRVTPEDYAANLREMSSIARRSGANMVVLTRPHLESEAGLAQSSGWRRRVPQYNAQARQVASELALPLVDAQRYFDGRHEAFADESHLTNAGHSTLAGLVEQALRNANLLPKS